eukprot:scaffold11.g3990.t1
MSRATMTIAAMTATTGGLGLSHLSPGRNLDDRRGGPDRRDEQRGGRGYGREEEEERRRERHGDDRGERRGPSEAEAEAEAEPAAAAAGPPAKKEPLSLEELLRKKQAEAEAQAKPVFLTKKQREELALARRAEEAEAQRQRLAALRQGLAPGGGGGDGGGSNGGVEREQDGRGRDGRDWRGGRDDGRGSYRGRDDDRRGADRRRDDRGRDDRGRDDRGGGDNKEDRERQRELELIKQQYLGGEKKKKKVLKATERFKFVFDWDAGEDTSRDLNPLYQNLHEANLLFGRGFRAGIDRREQKKVAAESEAELLRRMRREAGIEETAEDRQRDKARAAYADKYEGGDMRVDSHWSEKKLEDMTERDWRIFRRERRAARCGLQAAGWVGDERGLGGSSEEDFSISYKGVNPTLPLRNWNEASLPKELLKAIERAGYKQPSPIQRAAIPLGMQFRDVIGIAETGSGKTAAFVLPMLAYIMNQPPMKDNPDVEAEGPYAVVLAPTRELAQQIEEETRSLAHYTDFRVVGVVGGQNIEDQGFLLRKGCEIVVATPGRLVDCISHSYAVLNQARPQSRVVSVAARMRQCLSPMSLFDRRFTCTLLQCNYVVLDEADRMIDLGFEPQVMGVLDAMPSSNLKPENEEEPLDEKKVYRTTYMFSATMPPAVERLARKYLRRRASARSTWDECLPARLLPSTKTLPPVVVTIGTAGKATDNVTQRVIMCKDNEKPRWLEQELHQYSEDQRIIVFANTKRQCETVTKQLESLGHHVTMLHGGKTQDQREESIKGFREDVYNVLVATDVAGRGIDVPNVALVVNYDMALTIEAYTHRIGRTGRAGRKGTALTMLTGSDSEVFYDLKKFLEESKAAVPPQLASHEAARQKPGAIGGGRPAIQFAKK